MCKDFLPFLRICLFEMLMLRKDMKTVFPLYLKFVNENMHNVAKSGHSMTDSVNIIIHTFIKITLRSVRFFS